MKPQESLVTQFLDFQIQIRVCVHRENDSFFTYFSEQTNLLRAGLAKQMAEKNKPKKNTLLFALRLRLWCSRGIKPPVGVKMVAKVLNFAL